MPNAFVVSRGCGEVLAKGMILRYMGLSGGMGLSGAAYSGWWSLG